VDVQRPNERPLFVPIAVQHLLLILAVGQAVAVVEVVREGLVSKGRHGLRVRMSRNANTFSAHSCLSRVAGMVWMNASTQDFPIALIARLDPATSSLGEM
jgi:hypothetical protein